MNWAFEGIIQVLVLEKNQRGLPSKIKREQNTLCYKPALYPVFLHTFKFNPHNDLRSEISFIFSVKIEKLGYSGVMSFQIIPIKVLIY